MSKITVITSHVYSDLDSLASMVLAKKLYPNAKLVFSGNINKNVKEQSHIYKRQLNILKSSEIDLGDVERLILVDTANSKRIGKFEYIIDRVEVVGYDHHVDSFDLEGDNILIKEYGSTSSILLEIILDKISDIKFEQYELNIILMGIYEDTGSFIYNSTKAIDLKMASYLIEKGAEIEVVRRAINRDFSTDELDIVLDILEGGEIFKIGDLRVFIGKYSSESFTRGMDIIINKVADLEQSDITLIVYGHKSSSYIIARSATSKFNVSSFLTEFNGGGHKDAGSAVIKKSNYLEIYNRVITKLKESPIENLKAKDIMKFPVKTACINSKIRDVYKVMIRFGYSGLPIMDGEKIQGIISRKDIDKAMTHGFSNAPARTYMSPTVIVAKKENTVSELKNLLIQNEIGRLPIIENNILVGIVTRSDILRGLYDDKNYRIENKKSKNRNIKQLLESSLDKELVDVLEIIRAVSKERSEKVFLVGGIVRDLLLGIENHDVDIVVEGDGIAFAKRFGELSECKKIRTHEKFKTAVVTLRSGEKIDVASSRVEYYEFPTSLPTVEFGHIYQDMFRRDFTINSMAIEIDYEHFGELIDYYGGEADLESGKIKILHNLSFVEDPTRIIRAIRFANRYNFTIDEDSQTLIKDAMDRGFLEKLSWKRVKYEFQIILNEENVESIVEDLFRFRVIEGIDKHIFINDKMRKDIKSVSLYKDFIKKLDIEIWLVYFLIFLEELDHKRIELVFKKFNFPISFSNRYILGKKEREKISLDLIGSQKKSKIYFTLSHLSKEVVILLLITTLDEEVKKSIQIYFDDLMELKAIVTGKELIKAGLKPGNEFKEILKKCFENQLDNNLTVCDEILKKVLV